MSFVAEFNHLDLPTLASQANRTMPGDVENVLRKVSLGRLTLADFGVLVSPQAGEPHYLEQIAQASHAMTVKHFGRVMRFFAPLYLSNECINICKYCGFSRDNEILRVTLTVDQVAAEARYLAKEGFRNILLVAGEHPRLVSRDYLAECVRIVRETGAPSVNIEVAPMDTAEYESMVAAGAEGLIVYQETYNRSVYSEMHTSGPKRDFDWRLESAERGYVAGFRRLGIGALLGLWHWREEAIGLAAHAAYLLRHCWRSHLTISLPRLRPAAGEFEPPYPISERELTQLVCALRLMFPKVGLVLSTRETPRFRDGLIPLGITLMSAGAHTEPGGYTGVGKDSLHITKQGRHLPVPKELIQSEGEHATVQFEIADVRSPEQVAVRLKQMGYEAVWKDWDEGLLQS